jgi:FkbM family methyltransferase
MSGRTRASPRENLEHSFRSPSYIPSSQAPPVFKTLDRETRSDPKIHVYNVGLGSAVGRRKFFENDEAVLSSFLPPGKESWFRTVDEIEAEVETVDFFCSRNDIGQIDVLKSDTQGYDLEVLRGATRMMREARVKTVYFEVNFSEIYAGQGSFGIQYDLLTSLDFRLFSFYQIFRRGLLAAWSDALFVHRSVADSRAVS